VTPALQLPIEDIRILSDALVAAFPTRVELEAVVRRAMAQSLDYINYAGSLGDVAFDLVGWALGAGRLDQLLQGALEARPENAELLSVARRFGFSRVVRHDSLFGVGQRVGPEGAIQLKRMLGSTSWGSVWETWHADLGRRVALRLLDPSKALDPQNVREFRASAYLMKRCRHPGVVEVLEGCVEWEGLHYFVMPFLKGGVLHTAVTTARITPSAGVGVAAKVGDALSYIHQQRVLHNAVSPKHIVLDEDGSPQLSDFYHAILMDSFDTVVHSAKREFPFSAPECWDLGARLDSRSDQFSLGATTLFVLLGHPLTIQDWLTPERALADVGCPAHVKAAVARAMHHAPASRFDSVREFVDALRGVGAASVLTHRVPGPLAEEAQRFLTAAGFEVGPADEGGLRLKSQEPLWVKDGLDAISAYVHLEDRIDDRDVLAIQASLPAEPRAFVVTAAAAIDDAAWLQIATLRAKGFQLIPLPRSLLLGVRDRPDAARSDLRKHLDRFLGEGFNPFDVRNPVADSISFFGRASLIEEMTTALCAGDLVGLFGLRKIGKSSVLRVLAQRLPFPVAALDLEAGARPGDLLRRALRAWQIDARVRFHCDFDLAGFDPQSADDLAAFAAAVPNMIAANQSWSSERRLGLLLDETELLLPRPDSSANEMTALLRCLRGLHQEEGVLALMLVGYLPTINRQNLLGASEEQNPLFKLVGETWLDVLASDDCRQMVSNLASQASVRFSTEAVDRVVAASGAHPFLARQICSIVYKARRGRTDAVAPEEVDAAAARFVSNPSHNTYLSGLWEELGAANLWGAARAAASLALLRDLAQEDGPVSIAALLAKDDSHAREEAMEELLNRHIIREIPEGRERTVTITFDLFRRWIRRSQRA